MFNFNNLIDRFDKMTAAITFAEAGEREKALDILYDQPGQKKAVFNYKNLIDGFDRMMTTITFAEAGEREKALDILYDQPETKKKKRIISRISKQEETRPRLRA